MAKKMNDVEYPSILKEMVKVAGGVKQSAREVYDAMEQQFGSFEMEAVEGWLYDIKLSQEMAIKAAKNKAK